MSACSRNTWMTVSKWHRRMPISWPFMTASVPVSDYRLWKMKERHSRVERVVMKIRQVGALSHKPTNDPAVQVLVGGSSWRPVETCSQTGGKKLGKMTSRTAYGARMSCYQTLFSQNLSLVHEFRCSSTSKRRYLNGSGSMNMEKQSSSSWSPLTDHGMRRTSEQKQRTKPNVQKFQQRTKTYVMKHVLQRLGRQCHNVGRLRHIVQHSNKCIQLRIIKMQFSPQWRWLTIP